MVGMLGSSLSVVAVNMTQTYPERISIDHCPELKISQNKLKQAWTLVSMRNDEPHANNKKMTRGIHTCTSV